jgi:hypothetical protein
LVHLHAKGIINNPKVLDEYQDIEEAAACFKALYVLSEQSTILKSLSAKQILSTEPHTPKIVILGVSVHMWCQVLRNGHHEVFDCMLG